MHAKILRIVCSITLCSFIARPALADETAPAASQPQVSDLRYEVFQVEGRAKVAASGVDPLSEEGWTQLKAGDLLQAGQQVRTMMRGKVKLVARPSNPPTVLLIESGTHINISELNFTDGAAKSRIQLPYGAVRAGVAEGSTRSDMEIESPAATLSKRGTDIFRFEYVNGRYNISLSEQGRGLLQAIQTGQSGFAANLRNSRFITPGQFITHQLARAIDSMQFDRNINVNDVFGLSNADQLFTMINDRGFGFLLPQGNNVGGVVGALGRNDPNQPQGPPNGQNGQQNNLLGMGNATVRPNPGGDFGIGQGPLPNLFGPPRKGVLPRNTMNPLKRR